MSIKLFFLDDLISLLDINSHHGESVLLEADGALFDEDSFRLSRRLGSSRSHASSSSNNNNNNSNTNPNTAGSGGSLLNSNSTTADAIERDSRKSSYRIRDQRWYDSYRDELFSSSHHHHHHRSSSNSNNTTNAANDQTNSSTNLNDTKSDEFNNKKSSTSTANKPASVQPCFSFGENLQYWTDKVIFLFF